MDTPQKTRPIVMVDDDDQARIIAKRCMQRSTLDRPFLGLSDGHALFEYLERAARREVECPKVILLDINMPEMNGFAVLDKIQERWANQHLPPIVMLSVSSAKDDIDRALKNGAKKYQVKPSNVTEYVNFFNELITAC